MRRRLVWAMLAIGLGLIAAPAVFQMFTRAPLGGQMIEEFGPFMTAAEVRTFRGHLDAIGRADAETRETVRPLLTDRLGMDEAEFDRTFPAVDGLNRQWRGIDDDMSGMLQTMEANLDNFAAVDALPPFVLFPWFFVVPGLIVSALCVQALRAERRGSGSQGLLRLLAVMGVGLIAAPAIFQMFTRAPLGGQMIDEFRPLMTEKKVGTVQQYFLVIAGAEGELRTKLRPLLAQRLGVDDAQFARDFPSVAALGANWPRMSGDMAPMVGAMSDNLDNFGAVAALPPFPLFPWFFVAPGVLIAALAVAASRRPVSRVGGRIPKGVDPEAASNLFEGLREEAARRKAARVDHG